MPGNRLSDQERKLVEKWENRHIPAESLLSLSIRGDRGLRGIQDLQISFNYPITVISGRNGSGKTTILSLCALAFNGLEGYCPPNGTRNGGRGYYTFRHFFYCGPGDSEPTGIEIEWQVWQGGKGSNDTSKVKSIKLQRKLKGKWMDYKRRPKRAVLYLGMSRVITAMEKNVLKSYFGPKTDRQSASHPLNDAYRAHLGSILGSGYTTATEITYKDHSIRTCTLSGGVSYSSFNMGAGEDVVIDLLRRIQEMPKGSLCVIEEIELGIHPGAQARLAEVLQEIVAEKDMQFIISSHSEYFIDALPREARILLERNGHKTTIYEAPSTRFALGMMREQPTPELTIFCEDDFAKKVIEEALPPEIMFRVHISPTGSKNELVKAYCYWRKGLDHPANGIIVWDGDVAEDEIERSIKAQGAQPFRLGGNATLPNEESPKKGIRYTTLHPEGNPEINILRQLRQYGQEQLRKTLGFGSVDEVQNLLSQLEQLPDHHSFAYQAAQRLNRDEEVIETLLINIAVRSAPHEYENLVRGIRSILQQAWTNSGRQNLSPIGCKGMPSVANPQ